MPWLSSQLKEFSSQDNAELYSEEKAAALAEAEAQRMAIPGMANPYDVIIDDDL